MGSVSLEAAVRRLPACSRGTARKLRRATLRLLEKHPATAGWVAFLDEVDWEHRRHVLDWALAGAAPPTLTAPLREALLVALEGYPAALWGPREFGDLVAAVRRGVRLEAIKTWSWLQGSGEANVSLRDCPGPDFDLPLAVIRDLVPHWNWMTQSLAWKVWMVSKRGGRSAAILREPAFVVLPLRAKAWFLDLVLDRIPGGADPKEVLSLLAGMEEEALKPLTDYEGVCSSFPARVPTAAAAGFLKSWPKLRANERTGALIAIDLVVFKFAAGRLAVANAPAAVFARIAKARRNRQLWWDTIDSLDWLGRAFPALFCAGLMEKPELLFACGERLVAFGEVRSLRLLRELKSHSLFAPLAALPSGADALVALDRVLCEHRELALTVPAFRTWDRHFAGEKVLRRKAIEETGARMLEGLTAMRLRFLMATLEAELTIAGDAHAGLLRAGLRSGRRPLTRFLREFAEGRDRRMDHPANRHWLAKRPEFPLQTWLHPLRITLPVEGMGEVTLSVELDPFELLRVGTYAGSCLAAGGCNSMNAVALLLDVNKRAVFARSADGRFLARQIVAVSETERMVCYSVYPENSAKELEDFFQLFAEDWAMQMRLELARSNEDAEVAPLTVQYWYNDGLWGRLRVP